MTYLETLEDYLSSHKRQIQFALIFAAFFSVFLFYSNIGNISVNAADLSLYGTGILGGTISTALIMFATNASISLAPPIALSFTAIISILNDIFEFSQLDNYSFGLLDMWVFRIFVFVWAIASVLPRFFQLSHTVGVVIENVDNICGLLAVIIIPVSQVFGNMAGSEIVLAAEASSTTKLTIGGIIVSAVILIPLFFIYLVALVTGYIFINTFMFFIDVVLVPFCSFIPFLSGAIEILKICVTFVAIILSIFLPEIYLIPYLILLIISMIFFKKAWKAVKFFKSIYVQPLIARIFGYKKDISLVNKRVPKKLIADLNANDIRIAIPVYSVKKRKDLQIKKHEKWWFIQCGDYSYIRKKKAFSKNFYNIQLLNQASKKIFIKKSFRFFEIFTLENEVNIGLVFRNVWKDLHFVYSKEYFFKFDEIVNTTGFVDYSSYKRVITDNIKLTRRQAREIKRQEYLERIEEQRIQRMLTGQSNSWF